MSIINDMYGNGGYGDYTVEDICENGISPEDVECEATRFCNNCSTQTAQFVHATECEDIAIMECLLCGKKVEQII